MSMQRIDKFRQTTSEKANQKPYIIGIRSSGGFIQQQQSRLSGDTAPELGTPKH